MHGAPHAASGGKNEKSGHGRSCEIVLAVGLKTGGIGWPGPYLKVGLRLGLVLVLVLVLVLGLGLGLGLRLEA